MDTNRSLICVIDKKCNFHSELFMKDEFSVDEFLSKYGKITNLETLLEDLDTHLKTFRLSMVQLINKDYEDFVNLAAKLTDLDKKITSIQTPLCTMKENIENVKDQLGKSIDKGASLINSRLLLDKKKQSIQSIGRIQICLKKLKMLLKSLESQDISSTATISLLERTVAEVNQCYYFFQNFMYNPDNQHIKDYQLIYSILFDQLNSVFLDSFERKSKNLPACLRLYVTLNRVDDTHEIVRNKIIAPAISKFLSEYIKDKKSGLQKMYRDIISFIDYDLKPLLSITQPTRSIGETRIKGYNFLTNSLWPELENQLKYDLRFIFTVANPPTFQKNYIASMEFLDQFEKRIGSLKGVETFRALPSYESFINSWNLPIYFQLSFQIYAARLETVIVSEISKIMVPDEPTEWKLRVMDEAWRCLTACWEDHIFIRELFHRFWKFNLQIISRISVWIKDTLSTKCKELSYKLRIALAVSIYSDGEQLLHRTNSLLEIAMSRFGTNISPQIQEKMQRTLEESKERLHQEMNQVEGIIINCIVEETLVVVKQVNEIPRLFRRINRDNPTQACPYVLSLLSPAVEFNQKYNKYASKWLPAIVSCITSQYYDRVNEVLTSVQKTEESLRRFKKIRDPSTVETKFNTDDDKIRLQLQIDIQRYINMVAEIVPKGEYIQKLEDLTSVIHSLKSK